MLRFPLPALVFFLLGCVVGPSWADGPEIRRFCLASKTISPSLSLFIASDTATQQAAIKRNQTIQEGKIFFSKQEGHALFHEMSMGQGDCLLTNLQEAMPLEAIAVRPGQGAFKRRAVTQRPSGGKQSYLPVVLFVQRNRSKLYGLIKQSSLQHLRPAPQPKETPTQQILNHATDPDLFLIYITCPAARNGLCDLRIKEQGRWLRDPATGQLFTIPVLARARRDQGGRPSTIISRRTHINSDTPQGIYAIWGTVIDGGNSTWHLTPRIDLDAALPPVNGQPYNINSFLLSKLIPDEAFDDYWVNEWPLAYSLGRIALRIAPGIFEAQQQNPIELQFGEKTYNPTHGCINTGDKQEKLVQALVRAGVFAQEPLVTNKGMRKKWSVAAKLGKAFVIIKDRAPGEEM